MKMNYRYTKQRQPRGAKPDAEGQGQYLLLKKVQVLRATYQIRLLAFFAFKHSKVLAIRVPKECRLGKSLSQLISENPNLLKIERV